MFLYSFQVNVVPVPITACKQVLFEDVALSGYPAIRGGLKRLLLLISVFISIPFFCGAQNADSIYAFMNNELPQLELGKSSWGIFYLAGPYSIDSNTCNRIQEAAWDENEISIRNELYQSCRSLSPEWQEKFRWQQSLLHQQIIVGDTRHKIAATLLATLPFSYAKKKRAKPWIKEWNSSQPDERLINYSSIPVFSADRNYVLIVRGQDVRSEGGWDTIYIYRKTGKTWIVWKTISISVI